MGFITVEGENQIAAKQGAAQTLNITSFVLANIDGLDPNNEPANRIETMPAAGDIMATLAVTKSAYINTNQVVYSLVMDSSIGDYDFNWIGLIDDEGKLIAVTYTPLIQKRATNGAVPGNNLTRNFLIAFSGIQATTAIAVAPETWQIDFTARLWGIDERERLSNYDLYGHEGFIDTGWQVVREGATTTYDILPGVGYVGGVRIVSAVTQQVTVDTPPDSIWLDVSLQGDISDVSAVVDFVIDSVAHADYTDGNGFDHYLTKIATIAADGTVTDVRDLGMKAQTPPQFDDDTSIATTEFVQRALGNFRGVTSYNTDITLTVSDIGKEVAATSSAVDLVWTVLLANSVKAGAAITISNISGKKLTLQASGANTFYPSVSASTTVDLEDGATAVLISNGVNAWGVLGTAALPYAAMFKSVKSNNGYQKLPGGLIIQWGIQTADSNGDAVVTFPIAFPTACVTTSSIHIGTAAVINIEKVGTVTLTGCTFSYRDYNNNGGGHSGKWIAIGY